MSSKRAIRRRECENKTKFASLQDALDSLHCHMNKGDQFGGRMNAYKCHFCGAYHLGHTPANVRYAITKRWQDQG